MIRRRGKIAACPSSATKPGIELSELIKTVRLELQKAEVAGRDEQLRFRVDDVELEVSVEIRGGSWNDDAQNLRAEYRNANEPGNRNQNLGFRLVRAQSWAGWPKPDPPFLPPWSLE